MMRWKTVGLMPILAVSFWAAQARADDSVPAAPVPAVAATTPAQPAPAVAVPADNANAPAAAPAPASAPQGASADAQNGPPPAPQSYPSIMFWPDDAKAIDQAIQDHDHPAASVLAAKAQAEALADAAEDASKPRRPNVYVSAILDFGDGNWTVWANGLRVTPERQSPLFHIVAVHGDSVDIVVSGEGGGRFRLQPYQTWRFRQKDVVEGIFP